MVCSYHCHTTQAKLQWKRCADTPVEMSRPQAVVMGEKVYVGGGNTKHVEDNQYVFQYDPSRDEWSRLPPCQVIFFPMAQFMGHLITVGGAKLSSTGLLQGITSFLRRSLIGGFTVTGKVFRFKEESQKWEEFLKPMPTARVCLSVATTKSAIVASGGATGSRVDHPLPCATVEVYSSETSQWHTADPLPVPCRGMTSVTLADTWYLLGGVGTDGNGLTTVLHAPLTALIQKATSPTDQSASRISVWKNLPDTPLVRSAAASLSGNLLAVGGYDNKQPASNAVHVFFPYTSSWVRATTGDLPVSRWAFTSVQLSFNRVLVVGGADDQDRPTNTVFLGTITT